MMKDLFGLVWILFGLLMGFGHSGFVIRYSPPFPFVSSGEFNIWLVHFMFFLPGTLVLFWDSGPKLLALSQTVRNRVDGFSRTQLTLCHLVTLASLTFYYRLGRSYFFRDLPVTDEEYTGQFGGRLLASGRWMVDLNIEPIQMPTLFLLERGEEWASVDFIGIQLAWAFSELTQSGPWIFALFSAVTVIVFFLATREIFDSAEWAMVGSVLYALSPMANLLSFSTHAHIFSRFFLVLFLLFVFRTIKKKKTSDALMLGLAFGGGVLCRPAEMMTLSAPFLIYLGHGALRQRRSLLLAIVLGGLPTLALFIWHNVNVSGVWWQTPRMAENSYPSVQTVPLEFLNDSKVLLRRVTDNLLNNTMFTLLYWHGAIGCVLASLGLSRKPIPFLFLLGLVLHSAVALFHDNDGVRIVGPIHFSEWVVHLSFIATFGLKRLQEFVDDTEFSAVIARIAGPLLLMSILSTTILGLSVRTSNAWHEHFYTFINNSVPANSVVMAPRHAYFWRALPPGYHNGSWVFESRSPHPDFDEAVVFLRYTTGAESFALERFPDRRVFLAVPAKVDPFILVTEVKRTDSSNPTGDPK